MFRFEQILKFDKFIICSDLNRFEIYKESKSIHILLHFNLNKFEVWKKLKTISKSEQNFKNDLKSEQKFNFFLKSEQKFKNKFENWNKNS
jgi:hypothetical protein